MKITTNERFLIELVLVMYETLRDNKVHLQEEKINKINNLFDEVNTYYSKKNCETKNESNLI